MASDAQLLRHLGTRRGEDAARRLYRAYGGELFGFALHRLGDRGLAEELVQEVFTRVWRRAGDYDAAKGSVRTWIYGIARNAAIDAERHRARRPPLALDAPNLHDEPGDEPIERALLSWQVAQAFGRLSAEHREVLRLGHFGGLSVGEIAELIGVPAGTVKSRTYYAMRSMRLALEEMQVTP
jgi:RNA polymerase sigma-70 factor (ECF subfamily)